MKKLLLILFLLSFTFSFAQQNEHVKNVNLKTIENLTSSPNPFTSFTQISFYNNKDQKVTLIIKNLLGKTVYKFSIDSKKGNNAIPFYREDLTSGVYLYSIQTKEEIISKRLVVK